ncbi:MAG: phenylacetic acid degradation protein [Ardenticatenaceae bacterium]|nr:phenylacetic acid degradation protein [Ardenticatenaceae bacterium]MCB8989383.1 phenylacetic acid degradation protein [Ardenticatenaceae bacterium]MCB9004538.1 phenylacetic acid degradation protein [Ardenticatenaceae bacterium]
MSDTQWPRYEVFKQDSPNQPHKAVGSVHAPDAEMALLNARDVFARRPKAVSMWVAPASTILSMTAEEMAANPGWRMVSETGEGEERPFLIFTKTSQRRSMTFVTHVGVITAVTAQEALATAVANAEFDAENVWVWWVVPESAITRSDPDDQASHFAPAADKTYRQQSSYGFVGPTRKNVKRET